jgi:hypothetical protein
MTRAVSAPKTVTVHVPFRFVKRGGRAEMQLPDGAFSHYKIDNTLVKALARAFRWRRQLDSGEFATIAELAAKEELAASYLARVLRMTHLSPEIVEAILDGKHSSKMALADLLEPFPKEWRLQRSVLIDE